MAYIQHIQYIQQLAYIHIKKIIVYLYSRTFQTPWIKATLLTVSFFLFHANAKCDLKHINN